MIDIKRTMLGNYKGYLGNIEILGSESKNKTVSLIRSTEAVRSILDMNDIDPEIGSILEYQGKKYTLVNITDNFLMVIEGIGDFTTNFVSIDDKLALSNFGNVVMIPTPADCKFTFNEMIDVEYTILPDKHTDKAIAINMSMSVYELEVNNVEETKEEVQEETTQEGSTGSCGDIDWSTDEIPF